MASLWTPSAFDFFPKLATLRPMKMIRERFQVLEEDKSQTFRHGEPATPIGGASGNHCFIGEEGSGRRTQASLAAERLGLAVAEADSPEALARIVHGSNQAVAVTGVDLSVPDTAEALRSSGKVFYLMSMTPILAKRLGDLSRMEELAAEAERLEPYFMTAAHFILPVASTQEEMLEDVAEKARL